jgi:nitrate reductase gamma subunit
MNWNTLFFLIFPYISIALCVGVTIYRAVFRPFSISSLSSQLLERKQLFWGSISFHWGINLVLLGHLAALLLPRGLTLWNGAPIRLYLLEATGLVLGVWATAGMVILLYRRLTEPRIKAVTSPMDLVVLGLLLTSGITGILTATVYRFGSYWFTGIFTPYLRGLLTFQPNPAPLAPLPWIIQLHVLTFFVTLAVFPFSRLVHIVTFPLEYLVRPWQIVIAMRGRATSQDKKDSRSL